MMTRECVHVHNNNSNIINIFVKRHKVVTSEALATVGCVC